MKPTHSRVEIEFAIGGLGVVDGYAESDGERIAMEAVLDLKTLERSCEKLRGFDGRRELIVADQKAAARAKISLGLIGGISILTVRQLVKRLG